MALALDYKITFISISTIYKASNDFLYVNQNSNRISDKVIRISVGIRTTMPCGHGTDRKWSERAKC